MSGRQRPLDALDRAILEATQAGLPIVATPYAEIAARVGASESDVRARLQGMIDRGVVRRIGLAPDHYKFGLTCNGMTVWDVEDAEVDALGPKVGALDFVTHCYRRPRRLPDWPYNLFAMAHGRTRAEVLEKRARIAELLGPACRTSDILFSTEILKKTGMRLAPRAREEAPCSD
ncbi:MAG TPA: AsnC family transcriptional regulator [Rhodoblastus sp.]|nr:AsnC family transcriptional regulator [Rhodoblastus sp.]